jgi:HK97 family phage major capsid protein
MNDLSSTVGLMRREFRDVHSVVSRMDHQVRKLVDGRAAPDRPGGLIARSALCHVLGHLQGRDADEIARELFGTDRDLDRLMTLRAAVNPANTTVATWAAELAQTIIVDIADRLIPESAYVQLRRLGIPYELGRGAIKVPTWAPTATGGFIIEGGPIPVAQFVFGSTTLIGKKAASIVAVSDEMLLGAVHDVEQALRVILSESLGLAIDGILLGNSAATAAAPVGLLNGLTPITPSATSRRWSPRSRRRSSR